MRPAMSSEKKTVIAMRKKYSASTRPAMVDARSGNSGVPVHMSAPTCGDWGLGARGWATSFPANHHHDERAVQEHRRTAGETNRPHDDQAVAAGHRVVVKAVQQQ